MVDLQFASSDKSTKKQIMDRIKQLKNENTKSKKELVTLEDQIKSMNDTNSK